ncbi:MAG: hypothetical protein ACRC9L_04145 [Brevinema sp.]
MKNVVFLSLLVGLTACNLTSLRVVEDAPAGGDISGDINLPNTPNSVVPITNFVEYTNKAALAQFNVDVTDLIQYNTNFIIEDGDSSSFNWYFDNTINPTRVVTSTATVYTPLKVVFSQNLIDYTAVRLPDNTFTSIVRRSGASVQLPSGGMFLQLTRKSTQWRTYLLSGVGTGYLTDWNISNNPTTDIAWVKFFGNFAWVVAGFPKDTNPTELVLDEDPHTTSAYTNR